MKGQQGLALVLVLWVLSLLTIMAGSFALSMRREAAITMGIKNNAQALAIAESGITLAETMLLNPDPTKRWRGDGSIYHIDTYNAQLRVRLLAESGKVDINSTDEATLRAVLNNAPDYDSPIKVDLAAAIIDWRDADDAPHPQGAEKKQYREAGLRYAPRNKAFQSLDELQLVLGMNERLFNWLTPFITLYSGQPKVNVTVAAPELLYLLPELNPDLIASYVTLRSEAARFGLPTPPFSSDSKATAGALENAKTQNANTDDATVDENEDAALVSAPSETMTIMTEVLLADGSTASLSAIVERTEDGQSIAPFQVLQWQRNPNLTVSLFANTLSDLVVRHYAEPELND